MKKLYKKKTTWRVLNSGTSLPPCKHQLTVLSPWLSHVTGSGWESNETTTGMMEELEKLGVLVEIEILKNGITSESPLYDTPLPCPLSTWFVMHGGLNGRGGREKKLHKKNLWTVLNFDTPHRLRTPARNDHALLPCSGL